MSFACPHDVVKLCSLWGVQNIPKVLKCFPSSQSPAEASVEVLSPKEVESMMWDVHVCIKADLQCYFEILGEDIDHS